MLTEKLKHFFVQFERIGLRKLDRAKWPHLEPRAIQLTNYIALLGAATSLVQSAVEFIQGTYFYATSDLVGGLLMASAVGMNALGFLGFSRVFILLVLNLDIYYFNVISQFSAGLEILYFTFVLFPFFLFTSKERVALALTCLVPFTLFIVSKFFPFSFFIPPRYIHPAPTWYAMAAPYVAFPVTFFVIYRFLRINEDMYGRLLQHSKFASLGEFAAGVSHEINNPLTAIILNTQGVRKILSKYPDIPPKVDAKLEVVERAGNRAGNIIHGLRLFSREAHSDAHVPMNVSDCILETLAICEQRFRVSNVRLETAVEPTIPVVGNPTQISQVLVNILNNAFDAVRHTDKPWVKISASVLSGQVEVRIANSGPQIPKSNLAKIMEPFFTTKPVGEGTGMGLSISKGIVEAHHGDLVVESDAKHTTFVVTLPLASVTAP